METCIDKACKYAADAEQFESIGDIVLACRSYVMAAEQLDYARKHLAKDMPKLRVQIESKMEPMLARAEELKREIDSAREAFRESHGEAHSRQQQLTTTNMDDETKALHAALAGVMLTERPTTRFTDVSGLDDVKQALSEAVIFPVEAPQLYANSKGHASWAGILLYGPPGTGKTHVARAIAGESGFAFLSVSTADLVNKYVGQVGWLVSFPCSLSVRSDPSTRAKKSERLVRALFDIARSKKPCIVFIDEVESILPVRGDHNGHLDRAVAEFLRQFDGLSVNDNAGVLLMGATNLPWGIDPAALRRFERRIYVPLPDAEARAHMMTERLLAADASAQDIITMIDRTQGYSGADIKTLLKEVDMRLIRAATSEAKAYRPLPGNPRAFVPCSVDDEGAIICSYADWPDKSQLRAPAVKPQHFLDALDVVKPAVKQEQIVRYEEWLRQ